MCGKATLGDGRARQRSVCSIRSGCPRFLVRRGRGTGGIDRMQAIASIRLPDTSMTLPLPVFSAQHSPTHRFLPAKNVIPNLAMIIDRCGIGLADTLTL